MIPDRPTSFLLVVLCLAASASMAQDYDQLIQQGIELRNQDRFAEAEASFRQAHQQAADQRESYFLLGMTIAFQQRFAEARQLLERGVTAYPSDTNLQLALARVQAFAGDHQSAVQGYLQVTRMQPDQLEAMLGLHDSYLAMGNRSEAERWLESAAGLAPADAQVLLRQERLQLADQDKWQLSLAYGHSDFRRIPLDNWRDFSVELRHRASTGNDIYLRLQRDRHFGLSDTLVTLGTLRDTRSALTWGGRLDVGPDASFHPEYRINLFVAPRIRQGSARLGPTVLNLSAQYASYEQAEVAELGLSLDQYLFDGQLWFTPSTNLVNTEDGDRVSGWNLRLNWLANDKLLTGLGYGESPQTEAGATASTSSAHLYVRYSLTPRVDIRLDLERQDRENSYVRRGSTFSLSWMY